MPPRVIGTIRRTRLLAVGLGALLISAPGLAACGGDGESERPADAVDAFDFGFGPDELTASRGTTVTWTNTGDTIHTVKGPGFFSRAIQPGASYEFTFRKPGTYRYLCTLHPDQMRGRLIVEGPGDEANG